MALKLTLLCFAAMAVMLPETEALSLKDLLPAGMLERNDDAASERFFGSRVSAVSGAVSGAVSSAGSAAVEAAADQLQQLQGLLRPSLPPPIIATKTLVMEVTRLVTRHPVCLESHGRPSCKPSSYKAESDEEASEEEESRGEGLYVESSVDSELQKAETPEEVQAEGRSGRYLQFGRATPPLSEVSSSIADGEIRELAEDIDEDSNEEEGKLFFNRNRAQTKVVTKTLWVTKVQEVTDYRVTATLLAHNCVPSLPKFPRCPSSHKPPHKPAHKPGQWKEHESANETEESTTLA